MAFFLTEESASLYSSTSFFSVAVSFMDEPEELLFAEEVFFVDEVFFVEEVFFEAESLLAELPDVFFEDDEPPDVFFVEEDVL